jgi:hypothetical protein
MARKVTRSKTSVPFSFTAAAGQTSYTLQYQGDVMLFIGGAIQDEGTDYTVTDGYTLTFTTPLNLNDAVYGRIFLR